MLQIALIDKPSSAELHNNEDNDLPKSPFAPKMIV